MTSTDQQEAHASNLSTADVPADVRAILQVDLGALRSNFRHLQQAAGAAECAAVVKADAYGLGVAPVSQALVDEGCSTFFVATLQEGRRLRELHPAHDIYTLDGLLPGCAAEYAEQSLRPVLGSLAEITEWAGFCTTRGQKLAAALHIDTGMSRLGLPADETQALLADVSMLNAFTVALITSHLACADDMADPMTAAQQKLFEDVCEKLPKAPRSLANSAGTLRGGDLLYELARPGIALYGARAINDIANPMAPVAHVSARVLQIREIAAGETVGYGATYRADKPTRIATIALGYADGFLRAIAGGSGPQTPCAAFQGQRLPIVGRISMDMTAIDVTGLPADTIQRGSFVEMMGSTIGVDELADHAGTIGYELLTRLGSRLHRTYVGS